MEQKIELLVRRADYNDVKEELGRHGWLLHKSAGGGHHEHWSATTTLRHRDGFTVSMTVFRSGGPEQKKFWVGVGQTTADLGLLSDDVRGLVGRKLDQLEGILNDFDEAKAAKKQAEEQTARAAADAAAEKARQDARGVDAALRNLLG